MLSLAAISKVATRNGWQRIAAALLAAAVIFLWYEVLTVSVDEPPKPLVCACPER